MVQEVTVGLEGRSYGIRIGRGVRDEAAEIGGDLFLMTDSNVEARYGEWAKRTIRPRITFSFSAGEQDKTPETVISACRIAARERYDRSACFVALGGGVVGDMTGFAAAVYMRGVRFIQIPTTLLAMVDSSVGGKTAVDIPEGKNLVGAFHQPSAVLIDPVFLETLPLREIRCGLAEIVKTGVILDASLFAALEAAPDRLTNHPDWKLYEQIILRSCELKARVVAADERESGLRAILNYGHTFGHAVELLSEFRISHGEGVAIGTVAAGELAAQAGRWSREEAARQRALLQALGLPTRLPRSFAVDAVIGAMGRDKKNSDGRINLVLPSRLGAAELVRAVPESQIAAALEAIYA